MSPSTHQDSPKVPEAAYDAAERVISTSPRKAVRDMAGRLAVASVDAAVPHILSALLSDEVVEAVQVALEKAAEEASRRAMSGLGIPAAEAKALVSLLVDAETALQAAIEQVGGAK